MNTFIAFLITFSLLGNAVAAEQGGLESFKNLLSECNGKVYKMDLSDPEDRGQNLGDCLAVPSVRKEFFNELRREIRKNPSIFATDLSEAFQLERRRNFDLELFRFLAKHGATFNTYFLAWGSPASPEFTSVLQRAIQVNPNNTRLVSWLIAQGSELSHTKTLVKGYEAPATNVYYEILNLKPLCTEGRCDCGVPRSPRVGDVTKNTVANLLKVIPKKKALLDSETTRLGFKKAMANAAFDSVKAFTKIGYPLRKIGDEKRSLLNMGVRIRYYSDMTDEYEFAKLFSYSPVMRRAVDEDFMMKAINFAEFVVDQNYVLSATEYRDMTTYLSQYLDPANAPWGSFPDLDPKIEARVRSLLKKVKVMPRRATFKS